MRQGGGGLRVAGWGRGGAVVAGGAANADRLSWQWGVEEEQGLAMMPRGSTSANAPLGGWGVGWGV